MRLLAAVNYRLPDLEVVPCLIKFSRARKNAKTSARKSVLKRNGFVLRKPQQKQFVRKSGFNRRRKRYRLKKTVFSPSMIRG